MIVNEHSELPVGGMGGSIHSWERGLDPWHRDAFPSPFGVIAPNQDEQRKSGWFALDGFGNPIAFISDGDVWQL